MGVLEDGSAGRGPEAVGLGGELSQTLQLSGLQGLAGELESVRFATILFADLVGSTRLISALDPEDARDLLDGSIALIQQAIHDFDGLVVRVQGDGVMAVFGVHPAAADHALRGALAARQIVDRMRRGALGLLPSPQARVGLHAGPILLRRQDNDFGSIVDVVGHAAHLAGRIEQLAPPGSVAISSSTVSLIAEPCSLRALGSVASGADDQAGDDHGEAVFELVSIDFAGGDQVPVKGNATYPVTGRDGLLKRMRTLVDSLPDAGGGEPGSGPALAIVGEAGMGKSRLLLEASRHAAGLGVTFVVLRGNALMAAVPFGCLAPAVRHLTELLRPFCPDPASAAQFTHEQAACLQGFIANSADWLPQVAPGDRNRIAAQTIVGIVQLAVANIPLLLLIDDMQYVDKETRSVLTAIRDATRLGMIAAGRPEAALRMATLCENMAHLAPLAPSAARELVALISRSAPLDDSVVANILDRSGGLPLALQEFAVTAQAAPDSVRLPARLENLLAERLASLDADATRLCQFCSTLGPAFPASRLRKGAGLICRNPASAIARLVEARVIETTYADHVRFTHQLVQEAAYRTMARRRRTAMHSRALELLDPAADDAEQASHAELATHAEKAGLLQRALGHLWDACEQALGLAALGSVLVLYRRARVVAGGLPADVAAFETARFSLLAFDTLQQLSLEQETRADIRAIATGIVQMSPSLQTVARINMALLDWIDGAPVAASAWLTQAEADLAQRDSLPRRTYADVVGAYIAFSRARPGEAIARIERLSARLDDGMRGATFGAVVVIPHVLARAFGAWYLIDLGETARARSWIAEALTLSRRHRHNYSRLLANLAHGYLLYRQGCSARALTVLRRAYADCLRHRFHGFEPASASWLALSLIDQGLLDEADTILTESVQRGYFGKVRTAATYYLHEARTRLALAQGRLALAERAAHEALEHCRDCGEAMHELHALVLREEVRVASGRAPPEDHAAVIASLTGLVDSLGVAVLAERLARLREGTA